MTHNVFRAAASFVLLVSVCCGGCSNGGGSYQSTPTATPAPSSPTLSSIQITPTNSFVTAGTSQQLKASGTYSDNSTQDLTATATWSSSNTAVATVSSAGLATAVAVGTSTITASSGSVKGSTSLSVSSAAAGVTDSNGMATLVANGLTIPVQLTDQDTGAPLAGVAVGLGYDTTVPGSAVLVIADPTGSHPLQLILLESPSVAAALSKVPKARVARALAQSSPPPVTVAASGGCPLKSGTTASAAVSTPVIPPPPSPGPPSPAGLGQQLLDAINALLSLSSGVLPSGFQGPVSVQQFTATPGQSCTEQLTSIATTLLKQEAILIPGKILLVSLLPKSAFVAAAVAVGVIGTVQMLPTAISAGTSCYYGDQSVNFESICWGSNCLNIPLGAAAPPPMYPVPVTVQPPPCPSAAPGASCTPDSLTLVNSGNFGSVVVGTTNNSGDATVQVPAGANTVCVDSPGYQQFTEPGFIVSAPGTPLNVTLTPQMQPSLLVSPTSLSFSAVQGSGNPPGQSLTINSSAGVLDWNAQSNASWLSVSPASGATSGTVNVSVNITGLSTGAYSGAISFTATGATTASVPVTLAITTAGTVIVTVVGPGTVTSMPAGINCPGICTFTFDPNSFPFLIANPAAGAIVVDWTGACAGSGPSCPLTPTDLANGVFTTVTFQAVQ